jgi:hypothetical protein
MSKTKKQPKTERRFSKLNAVQTAQFYNWLTENPHPAISLTGEELAKMAGEALGFPISKSSAFTIRDQMGIEVERPSRAKRKVTFELVRMLARELVDLRRKLNEPVSKELEDLSK